MSWSPGEGVETSIGLGVGYKEPVDLSVSRDHRGAYLVLGDHVAEIRLERLHLETLRDQLPAVLADLDLLDAADTRAADAGSRAIELAAYLTDEAVSAELAGHQERAGELRGTVDKLNAATDALENALVAVASAAFVADQVAENARTLLTRRAPGEQPVGDRPAGAA